MLKLLRGCRNGRRGRLRSDLEARSSEMRSKITNEGDGGVEDVEGGRR